MHRQQGGSKFDSGVLAASFLVLAIHWVPLVSGQTIRDWQGSAAGDDWYTSNQWSPSGFPSPDDYLFVDFDTPTTSTLVAIGRGGLIDLSGNAAVTFGALDVGHLGTGQLAMSEEASLSTSNASLGEIASAVGTATVSGNAAWNSTQTLLVGEGGQGSLYLSSGATVGANVAIRVGELAAARGAIKVSGPDSTLTTSQFDLGREGVGSLEITSASFASDFTQIGYEFSAAGTALLRDGAIWANTGEMLIGLAGFGSLDLESGSQVTTGDNAELGAFISGRATVHVDGKGSLWDISGDLIVGQEGDASLSITNGGRVENNNGGIVATGLQNGSGTADVTVRGIGSTWHNAAALTIGEAGAGSLIIEQAGVVENASANLAVFTPGRAEVVVTGAGSRWTNTGKLTAADDGIASIQVRDGGTLETGGADLARSAGSLAQVVVDGHATTWTDSQAIVVGFSGVAELAVLDGAQVSSSTGVVSLSGSSAGSLTTVDGDGSRWTTTGGMQVGSGNGSVGTLNVAAGGHVASGGSLTIGNGTGSTGRVIVGDTQSSLSVGDVLRVGNAGTGVLTIENGATASVVNEASIGADGVLEIDGGTLTTRSLTAVSGSALNFTSGELRVEGGILAGDGLDNLVLDSDSLVTLTISDGAEFNVADLALTVADVGTAVLNMPDGVANTGILYTVGNQAGSHGTVKLSGASGHLFASDEFVIGNFGQGVMNISDGAEMGSDFVALGYQPGSAGKIFATDRSAGATIVAGSGLIVGREGNGELHLSAGATATTGDLRLGTGAGGKGLVTIGDDSSVVTTNIAVGAAAGGTGRIEVGQGGILTNLSGGTFDIYNGSQVILEGGTLDVSGVGGTIEADAKLDFKAGTLNVAGTGAMQFEGTSLVIPSGGTLNLGSALSFSNGGRFTSLPGSVINITANGATLGNPTSAGIDLEGELHIGAFDVSLNTPVFAPLGSYTTIEGGTISSASSGGIALGPGDVLLGFGEVNVKVAAAVGSTIRLTADTTLGNSNSHEGFVSDGGLFAFSGATVTLNDLNQANLGLSTFLQGGELVAAGGVIVDFGEVIFGEGIIDTPDDPLQPTIINGQVDGSGPGTDSLVFQGYVKGVGTFDNVIFNGTHAPGFSPAALNVGAVRYAPSATLEIELAGSTPGAAFDQINSSGSVEMGGTLAVELLNGFVPAMGETFEIITASGGLNGTFASENFPAIAANTKLATLYSTDSVTLVVVPLLPGDYNADGVVNLVDYTVWRDNLGVEGVGLAADGDLSGVVDVHDYELWKINFGATLPSAVSGTQSVPEPSTCIACALFALACTYYGRKA